MQSTIQKTLLAGVCTLSLMFAFQVNAATQGTLGATSTGAITINVTKSARVQISQLSDLTSTWSENGDVSMKEEFCVYSNAAGKYKVSAAGSGAGSVFALTNGANNLPYVLKWSAHGSGGTNNPNIALLPNITSAEFANASSADPTCASGKTAGLEVFITSNDMAAALAGNYAGTLTLLVSPS